MPAQGDIAGPPNPLQHEPPSSPTLAPPPPPPLPCPADHHHRFLLLPHPHLHLHAHPHGQQPSLPASSSSSSLHSLSAAALLPVSQGRGRVLWRVLERVLGVNGVSTKGDVAASSIWLESKCCMMMFSKYFSLYSFATPCYHLYDSLRHINGVAVVFAQRVITRTHTQTHVGLVTPWRCQGDEP